MALLLTWIFLTLPLAIGVLIERYLFRVEKNYMLEGVFRLNEIDRLVRADFLAFDEISVVAGALFIYGLIDNFHELRTQSRRQKSKRGWWEAVKRFISTRNWTTRLCDPKTGWRRRVRRIRRRVQIRRSYCFLFNFILVSLMFAIITGVISSKNQILDKVAITPMAESPLKTQMQDLAAKAGVDSIDLYIAHVSQQTSHMNASGRYRWLGANITIYDTVLISLLPNELRFIVGHELYHVTHLSSSSVIVGLMMVIAPVLLIVFGLPRRRKYVNRRALSADAGIIRITSMVPRYLCVGLAAWLLFHAAACALQRGHESEADRYALRLTSAEPAALSEAKNALIKINQEGIKDPSPPWLFHILFNDHPSHTERLRNVEEESLSVGHP